MISFLPFRKFNVQDNGLWTGMTEIHCHLLPGVDDGVETGEQALRILRFMEEEVQVSRVCITPHTMMDFNNAPGERLHGIFQQFLPAWNGKMELHIASEYMIDSYFSKRLSEGLLLLGIRNQRKLVLVELPAMMRPPDWEATTESIFEMGYTPVIAHPERYHYIRVDDCRTWRERGCLLQLNLPSLHGYYGKHVERLAYRLLDEALYDFAGFDIHRYEGYAAVIRQLNLSRKRMDRLSELLDNARELEFLPLAKR